MLVRTYWCISKEFDARRSKPLLLLQKETQNCLKGICGIMIVRYLFLKELSVGNLYDTEQLISQAEQQGNRMIQIPALLIGALLSLRSRAHLKLSFRRKGGAANRNGTTI